MSAFELAGLALATVSLVGHRFGELEQSYEQYGLIKAFLLHTVFRQSLGVTRRIQKHVLGDIVHEPIPQEKSAQEAWSLKESYATSFNMIAVAGAIVASIAITALSLPHLDSIYWTAQAAFVISLVAGLLSVYFACMIQQQLSALQSPDEVRQWLLTTKTDRRTPRSLPLVNGRLIPSYSAALLLVVPAQLLNWSSISLLAGIGAYYGLVYSAALGTLEGHKANLAILLVYIFFTCAAISSYLLPWLAKEVDSTEETQKLLAKWVQFRDPRTRPNLNVQQQSDIQLVIREASSSNSNVPETAYDGPVLPPAVESPGSRLQAGEQASTQPPLPATLAVPLQAHLPRPPPGSSSSSCPSSSRTVPNPRTPVHHTATSPGTGLDLQPAILMALRASISAQEASLQAQEELLRKLSGTQIISSS